LTDGDTFFALATGERPVDADDDAALFGAPGSRAGRLNLLLTAAADAVTRAIVHAVLSATSAGELRSYADWFRSAVGQAPARR
jgi:L-aminopeptidase/D-esterase-like protein